MFTGIIETMGKIEKIDETKFYLSCPFLQEIKVGDSIAHDGVCLTVSKLFDQYYEVELIPESFERSHFSSKKEGDFINLERSMKPDSRFDGHIVQGHCDCTARVENIHQEENSYLLTFSFPQEYQKYFVEKGSVTINGISLTVIDVTPLQSANSTLTVGIIPHTWKVTNLQYLEIGSLVNIETDLFAKYFVRLHKTAL